jgi:Transposase IS116/IS110/IS902 family
MSGSPSSTRLGNNPHRRHGVGDLGAAIILGHTADITRFPDAGHFARYNATAPIAASSALKHRHRLNPHGNRQLNRAIHVAAVTHIAHDTDGRIYYRRKPETATKACQPAATSQRRIAGMTGNATEIWARPERSIRARQNAVEPCVCRRLSARWHASHGVSIVVLRGGSPPSCAHARSSSSSPPVRPGQAGSQPRSLCTPAGPPHAATVNTWRPRTDIWTWPA